LFGVNTKAVPQIVQSDIIFKEVAILGTWLANSTFPRAVEILESGVLDLDCLVTDVMPLDELESGIDKLRSGNGIEIIITI
jgi:threonine dehydrogenase-like Zn-dependent dehydrogenase